MITASYPSQHKIVSIHGIYHIEYLMEDIRVTYKRDTKLKVGDIMIDAKEGDISSFPRWLANALLEQGIIETRNNDISAYVSRALNRERIARPHDLSSI